MAIIQQIQQKTGCLFLVILGALLIFLLSELFRGDRSIFGDNTLSVGEIKGEQISYEEFDIRLKNMLTQLEENNPGMKITEEIRSQYADQTWNSYLQDKIFGEEYSKLGIVVAGDEVADMTIGDHPDEQVLKAFTPQGGQFDRNRLIKFVKEDIEADEASKARWIQFEEGLIQGTMGKKYAAIIKGSVYTTKLEAINQFKENNYAATANFASIQYATIPDNEIKVTDEELKKELTSNKDKYKQDASRDIEFVSLSIEPTAEDSAATKNWAYSSYEGFKVHKYDSVFVNINNSEDPWDGTYKTVGSFDKTIEPLLFGLDSGGMLGPIYTEGKYSIYKISGIKKDSQSLFKVSHILIPTRNAGDSLNAEAKVNSMMNDLASGKITFENATIANADGSGQAQGDLGFISPTSGTVTQKFYDFAATQPVGKLFIISDEAGIHIAKVTSPKYNKRIKVAILSQSISSGSNTIRTASDKGNDFLTVVRTSKDFGKVAESKGLTKRIAYGIKENDISIAGISEPKQIIRWLYSEDTKEGTVSEMLSFPTNYVIAKCTKIKKEGLPTVEEVRPALESAVRNRKKAEKLTEKFEAAKAKSKNIEELAKNTGTIPLIIAEQLFANDNVASVGYDLKVLGALFGAPLNKFSPVIRGENAVYVLWVKNINQRQAPPSYDDLQRMNTEQLRATVDGGVMDALRKKAEIKDLRYKYF